MTGKNIVKDAEHNTKTSYTADITSGYKKICPFTCYHLPPVPIHQQVYTIFLYIQTTL
mgnify:FL=1